MRIGLEGLFCYTIAVIRNPTNPILIIKVPTLPGRPELRAFAGAAASFSNGIIKKNGKPEP